MSAHHVDLPEQVVTPGEELWVKIIDLDLQRRRISLSIKQAAEGGVVAAEYQEHFGEHAYDDEGNYIGAAGGGEGQEAWEEYFAAHGDELPTTEEPPAAGASVVDSSPTDGAESVDQSTESTEQTGEEQSGETTDESNPPTAE
jgi:small subunit ribosomal protein S1